MKKVRGFTLIELMIVVAVVAILAAVAITSYTNQIRKSKRSEAKQVLSDLALRQEKRRATSATYTTTLGTGGLGYSGGAGALANKTPSGYYNLALTTPTGGNCPGTTTAVGAANSFRITATATGDMASDTDCATLVLTSICGRVTKTSTGGGSCW